MDELCGWLLVIEVGGEGLVGLECVVKDVWIVYCVVVDVLIEVCKVVVGWFDVVVVGEFVLLKFDVVWFWMVVVSGLESENGVDRVEFEVFINFGVSFGLLFKIVLGGELLCFIFVLKVVLVEEGVVVMMIFDEIDCGVGGVVVSVIGECLLWFVVKM